MPERPVTATLAAPVAGTDAAEATRILRGELGAPHPVPLPELAELSPGTLPLARAATHLAGLSVDLTPHGWRLTAARAGASALARRVAAAQASLTGLSADLLAGEPAGATLVRLTGPATLAARMSLPGGEPVLSDPGALRDLAQAWAEGAAALAAATTASLPGAETLLWIDEPDALDVVHGRVRSSSGYRALPAWDRAAVRAAWEDLAARTRAWFPLVTQVGHIPSAAAHVLPAPGQVPEDWSEVASLVEAGGEVVLTLPPTLGVPAGGEGARRPISAAASALATPWRRLGLPAAALGALTLAGLPSTPLAPEALRRGAVRARDVAEALDTVRRDDLAALS